MIAARSRHLLCSAAPCGPFVSSVIGCWLGVGSSAFKIVICDRYHIITLSVNDDDDRSWCTGIFLEEKSTEYIVFVCL